MGQWLRGSISDTADVPAGGTVFPKDLPRPSRRWAEKPTTRAFPLRDPGPDEQPAPTDPSIVRRSKDGRWPLADGCHHFVIMPNDEVRTVADNILEDLWEQEV